MPIVLYRRTAGMKVHGQDLPKIMAPTERSISTRVMPNVISFVDRSNVFSSPLIVNETVKKSNASLCHSDKRNCARVHARSIDHHMPATYHVQPKKATKKKSHCCVFNRAKVLKGFGNGAKGGLSVGMRVLTYSPTLICCSSWTMELSAERFGSRPVLSSSYVLS